MTYDSASKDFISKVFANFGFVGFRFCQLTADTIPNEPNLGQIPLQLALSKMDDTSNFKFIVCIDNSCERLAAFELGKRGWRTLSPC